MVSHVLSSRCEKKPTRVTTRFFCFHYFHLLVAVLHIYSVPRERKGSFISLFPQLFLSSSILIAKFQKKHFNANDVAMKAAVLLNVPSTEHFNFSPLCFFFFFFENPSTRHCGAGARSSSERHTWPGLWNGYE